RGAARSAQRGVMRCRPGIVRKTEFGTVPALARKKRARPGHGEEALDKPQCYIITTTPAGSRLPMPTDVHPQHHHHPPGEGHPPATVAPSILRLSVLERLVLAAAAIAVIWGAVIWAMQA